MPIWFVVAFLPWGCGFGGGHRPPIAPSTPGPDSAPDTPDLATGSSGASVFSRPLQRLVVEFTVMRFSAPKGAFTGEAGPWKLVNGALGRASMSLDLAANGIRAAVGRESDRPALKSYMESIADLRTADGHLVPDETKLVEVELGPCQPQQAIFYYDHSGAIHGMDFLNARAKIKIGYEMRFSNLEEVLLELRPEIEEPPGPPTWVINPDGTARQAPQERLHSFDELLFSARIPPGGFLLLGPTAAVHDRPLLAGPLFLEVLPARQPGGAVEIRESVCVISPVIRSYQDRGILYPAGSP